MSDEIPFLIREPVSRAFGISNENWQQPTEFTARVDLTCGFEMKHLVPLDRPLLAASFSHTKASIWLTSQFYVRPSAFSSCHDRNERNRKFHHKPQDGAH